MGFHWSYGSHTGPVRNPCGIEHTEKSKSPVRGPYEAPAGATLDPCGVLRFIFQKYKCGARSSCMGPVDWWDHKDGTGASLLRTGNRTGAKKIVYVTELHVYWRDVKLCLESSMKKIDHKWLVSAV